jgi:hypothetical protein
MVLDGNLNPAVNGVRPAPGTVCQQNINPFPAP